MIARNEKGQFLKGFGEQVRGEKNNMWRGDDTTVFSLHGWLANNMPRPEYCEECLEVSPYDIANVSPKYDAKTYNREFKNWRWLCRRCHMKTDGRLEKLILRKNPNHLKGMCKRGHPYSGENSRVNVKRGRAMRTCRVCDREGRRTGRPIGRPKRDPEAFEVRDENDDD